MSLALLVGHNGKAAAETRFYIATTKKKTASGVSKIGNTPECAAAPPQSNGQKGRTFCLSFARRGLPKRLRLRIGSAAHGPYN
jgi:hypothetical protein